MTSGERLEALTRWFQYTITEPQAIVSDETLSQPPLSGALSTTVDYFAILEVAWQAGFFGSAAAVSDWTQVATQLTATDWGALRTQYAAAERVQLVDRLRARLNENLGDSFEVPPELFSDFLQFCASPTVQSHFGTFRQDVVSQATVLVETCRDPYQMATVLLGSEPSSLRTAARALNDALDFLIHRYTLVRALDPWPVVQRSIMIYLDDAAWPLQRYPRLIDDCVSAMNSWPSSDGATEDEAERIRAHMAALNEATSAMFVDAFQPAP